MHARDLFERAKCTAGSYQKANDSQGLARHEGFGKRFLADEIPYSMRWTCLELVALYVLDMSYLFVLVSMQ